MTGPGIIDTHRAVFRSDLVPAGISEKIWLKSIQSSLAEIRQGNKYNNIRDRSLPVILDDKVRGKALENALPGILIRERLVVRRGEYDSDRRVDIDFVFRGIDRDYTIELKSSALPKGAPTIEEYLAKYSMVVIATRKRIEEDVNRDIYIQGIYDIQTEDRDAFCSGLKIDDIDKVLPEEIYYRFKYATLSDSAYFVSWAPKQQIIGQWDGTFWYQDNGKKAYYTCPICWARKMPELYDFLRYGEKCYTY